MPRSISRRLLVALGVCATAAAAVLSTEPALAAGISAGTMTGHVTLVDGSPAADVPIELVTTFTGEYPDEDALLDPTHDYAYTATTDADGDYTVPGVQEGSYIISVAPSSVWARVSGGNRTAVIAGASAIGTTLVVSRVATLNGTVESAEDGAPIKGADVTLDSGDASEQAVRSISDGGFTIHAPAGSIAVRISAPGRFDATRTVTVDAGGQTDLGAVLLDPSGIVTTRIESRTGHAIRDDVQHVVVDGCELDPGLVSTCPGAAIAGNHGVSAIQLAPGTHTIRYVVRAPLSTVVHHATKTVVVKQGRKTALAPIVFRADPTLIHRVQATTYRAGKPVTVRVELTSYTDQTQPRLRTTFLANGHAVTPTSASVHLGKGSARILVATLPARWSSARTLSVQAVEHGTAAYAGTVSTARVLNRVG